MYRKPAPQEINPDQGALLIPGPEGYSPALTQQQAFTSQIGENVNVEARSRNLIEAINLMGKMSSNGGFNKAQFNPQENQNLYDDIGVDGVRNVNTHIDRAKAKRPEKLRTLFSEATGYETQNPKADDFDPQAIGNVAFKAFRKSFEGLSKQDARVAFREDLRKQRKKYGFAPVVAKKRKRS